MPQARAILASSIGATTAATAGPIRRTSATSGSYALAVDSCDPRGLLAGGYELAQRGSVQRSFDGGSTWSPSLLEEGSTVPEHGLDARAGSPPFLLVFRRNFVGALLDERPGSELETIRARSRRIDVQSLALDPSGRFLYAGTERGVFRLERSFEPCRDGPDRLCLLDAKYQVSVTARDRAGTLDHGTGDRRR